MKLNFTIWNKKTYQEYLRYLENLSDKEYKAFSEKTCFTNYEMLGIRVPILREIAKKIKKETEYEEFLQLVQNKSYEETMIEGFVIASIKEEEKILPHFHSFLPKIDNWGICDSFCNSLQIVKKNPSMFFALAKELALQEEEFISRVGLIILLNFFVKEEYCKEIFELLDGIKSDKYYINMAEAWLLCELYIYYPQETESYLKKNQLNKFTHNKAISKIRESYRVSKEKKDYLNTLKRK